MESFLLHLTKMANIKELSPSALEEQIIKLKARFEKNMNRHKSLDWHVIQSKLESNPRKLWSLQEMERTGGALFADYRYGQVFVYHNSAPSYYSSRGFRGTLKV